MNNEMGVIETYRGCPIHDCQPQERIDAVVKPEIDEVIATSDSAALMRWCGDVSKSPESRLLAAAKLEAGHQIAATERRVRPTIDLDVVRATVSGAGSRTWRCPDAYCSLLDMRRPDGAPKPAVRPQEFARQVEEDKRRLDDERRASLVTR
jgi:hypothetical protein